MLGGALRRARFAAAAVVLAMLAVPAGLSAQAERKPVVVTCVGLHGGAFARLLAAAGPQDVECRYLDDDAIAGGAAAFARSDAVLLQHVRDPKELAAALLAGKQQNPELRVFALSGAAALSTYGGDALVEIDARLADYYKAPRQENFHFLTSQG